MNKECLTNALDLTSLASSLALSSEAIKSLSGTSWSAGNVILRELRAIYESAWKVTTKSIYPVTSDLGWMRLIEHSNFWFEGWMYRYYLRSKYAPFSGGSTIYGTISAHLNRVDPPTIVNDAYTLTTEYYWMSFKGTYIGHGYIRIRQWNYI